jgi:hypothetical protein
VNVNKIVSGVALVAMLGACAGRDPHLTQTVQPQDAQADCTAINAQLVANNTQLASLKREGGNTQAGNIALGVAGAILFWPALFAMDFKDASGKEAASIQQRKGYLQQLAAQKGCPAVEVTQ